MELENLQTHNRTTQKTKEKEDRPHRKKTRGVISALPFVFIILICSPRFNLDKMIIILIVKTHNKMVGWLVYGV